MRKQLLAKSGAFVLILSLAGCSVGTLVGAPTPEPWSPPPTATIEVVAAASPTTPANEPTPETVAVERVVLPDQVSLNGWVAPVLERELAFRQDGVLRNLYAEAGIPVTAGQLLAELDLGTLREQLNRAIQVARQDEIALSQASNSANLAVRNAEIALEAAQARFDELRTPPPAQELAKAHAAVARAEAALARTRNDASALKSRAERAMKDAVAALTSIQQRYGEAVVRLEREPNDALRSQVAELTTQLRSAESAVALAQIDLDTARGNEIAAVQAAEADLLLAQATLGAMLATPDPFKLAEAERTVRLASIALEAARQQASTDPNLAKVLASSQLAVKEIENQIEARRIYAPFDGIITAVDALTSFPVQAEVPIIRIMDRSGLQVSVPGIGEAELARLSVGTEVQLRFARYPERSVTGTVQRAAVGANPLASGPSLNVAYNAPGLDLVIGDAARIEANFGTREGVLLLPARAIRRDGGTHVIVQDGTDTRRVAVGLGLVTGDRIEVLGDLGEGELVLVP
ncbi:MAG: efflux RND transporter periplasmic adaptor subunit [Oscillochloridaceae bacterium umkhey_bin13]